MGFCPRTIDRMSIAEFVACVDGWNKAHGDGKKKRPLGDMDQADLRALGVEGF